jgi:hypothetical protein
MNLLRTLRIVALLALTGGAVSGCFSPPDYPDTPQISEHDITVFRKTGTLGTRDSVEIALDFKDGNGDLGLGDADNTGIYAYNNGNNRFYNNFFVQVYYKSASGSFLPLPISFPYDGRFPRLTVVDTKEGPLKGVLRYAIVLYLGSSPIVSGTELRFVVSIADRGLHESNVITTKSVVL